MLFSPLHEVICNAINFRDICLYWYKFELFSFLSFRIRWILVYQHLRIDLTAYILLLHPPSTPSVGGRAKVDSRLLLPPYSPIFISSSHPHKVLRISLFCKDTTEKTKGTEFLQQQKQQQISSDDKEYNAKKGERWERERDQKRKEKERWIEKTKETKNPAPNHATKRLDDACVPSSCYFLPPSSSFSTLLNRFLFTVRVGELRNAWKLGYSNIPPPSLPALLDPRHAVKKVLIKVDNFPMCSKLWEKKFGNIF